MKALLLYIFSFHLFFACFYASSINAENSLGDCDIEKAKESFSYLSFDGPLNVELIKSLYEERSSNSYSKTQDLEWVNFIELASSGGCVYSFTSDEKSWNSLSGVKGYALIEDGSAVIMIITKKS